MDNETQQWLAEGIAQAQAGQGERARDLFLRVVERDERNVQAWLWLAGVVNNPEDKRIALENALTIEPDNATAQAGLEWLNRQPAVPNVSPPQPPTPAQDSTPLPVAKEPVLASESVFENPLKPPSSAASTRAGDGAREASSFQTVSEECPYCGQPVDESNVRCPHCSGTLTILAPQATDASRVGLLSAFWLVQAAADVGTALVMILALQTMGGAQGMMEKSYVHGFLAGAAFTSGLPTEGLLTAMRLFIGFDAVALAWSLTLAVILPARRPAAPVIGLFVAAFHLTLAGGGLVVGMTSILVAVARAIMALFIGFWQLESHGDFEWKTIRHRLKLDTTAKSSMDYYTQGRYYRRIGQTAKAILHLERANELDPQRYEYHVALANAYYALGRYGDAAGQLRAALQLNPNAPDVREFLDVVMARLSESEARVV